MKSSIELIGLTQHTQKAYMRQVSQFSFHLKNSPHLMDEKKIEKKEKMLWEWIYKKNRSFAA